MTNINEIKPISDPMNVYHNLSVKSISLFRDKWSSGLRQLADVKKIPEYGLDSFNDQQKKLLSVVATRMGIFIEETKSLSPTSIHSLPGGLYFYSDNNGVFLINFYPNKFLLIFKISEDVYQFLGLNNKQSHNLQEVLSDEDLAMKALDPKTKPEDKKDIQKIIDNKKRGNYLGAANIISNWMKRKSRKSQ